MRLFLLLLGVIPLLALGLDVYFKERAQERDARLVATANRLLIEATASSQAARTIEIRRIAEAEPGLWQVQGQITLQRDGKEERSAYSVEIEQRCSNLVDNGCWRPHALVIGEEILLSETTPAPIAAPGATSASATPSQDASLKTGARQSVVVEAAIESETAATTATKAATEAAPERDAASADGGAAQAEDAGPVMAEASPLAHESAAPQSDVAAASAAPPAAPPATAAIETVEMSVEESLVWLIQDRLTMLGYGEPGALRPSGVLDAPTKGAIEAYQFAHGLARDGQPSFELLDRIETEAEQRSTPAATEASTAAQAEPAPSAPPAPTPMVAAPAAIEPAQSAAAGLALQSEAAETAGTAAPSWVTASSASGASAGLAELEEGIAPAAGVAESDEMLPDAQGDAELEPGALAPAEPELAESTAAAPQVARVPESENASPVPEPEADGDEVAEPVDESLVFLIQDRLNRLGYDQPTPIVLNGKLGSRTRLAIFDYQQKNRLPKDSRPTEALLRHIEATLLGRRGGKAAAE